MPAPGGILTLDLSLTVGWAYGKFGERPIWGHWNLGKMIDGAKVTNRLEDHIDDTIRIHQPWLVVYEAPFAPQKQDRAAQGRMLLGLATITEHICERNSVLCREQDVNQTRAAVLGKKPNYNHIKIKSHRTLAVKNHIIRWAMERGWAPVQDDEADALMLLVYATVTKDQTGQAHFLRQGELL